MVLYKLFSILFTHCSERVVGSFELSFKGLTRLFDFLFYFKSLFSGYSRSKRIVSEVPSNSDSSGFYHGCFILWEGRAFQLWCIHTGHMFVGLLVLVVVKNNLVEKRCKGFVWIVWASVNSNSRVKILAARENADLEWNSMLIFFACTSFPDSRVETFC